MPGRERKTIRGPKPRGENKKRCRPQRTRRLRASRPPKDSSPTPSLPSPTTPDYTQYPFTSTPRPGILHAKGSAFPQQPIVCPLRRPVNPSLTPTSDLSGSSATGPRDQDPPCNLAGSPAAGASIPPSPGKNNPPRTLQVLQPQAHPLEGSRPSNLARPRSTRNQTDLGKAANNAEGHSQDPPNQGGGSKASNTASQASVIGSHSFHALWEI